MVKMKHVSIRSDGIACQRLSTVFWGDEGPDG